MVYGSTGQGYSCPVLVVNRLFRLLRFDVINLQRTAGVTQLERTLA